jgi:hypothetical protein
LPAGDDAVLHREARLRDAETGGREVEQRAPGGRSGSTGLLATRLHALATDARALVRRDVRVVEDGLHLREAHVELLGRDHEQRRRRALTHLDLAHLEAGRVVGVDRQPRVDRDLVERAVRGIRIGCGLGCLGADTGADDAEGHDHRAAALHERLARELLVQQLRHDYFPPFAITAAAFWMAVRIRGYVPQRQRWPFMAVRICASVGRFVVASRSAAWIIIPFWQ